MTEEAPITCFTLQAVHEYRYKGKTKSLTRHYLCRIFPSGIHALSPCEGGCWTFIGKSFESILYIPDKYDGFKKLSAAHDSLTNRGFVFGGHYEMKDGQSVNHGLLTIKQIRKWR